LRFNAGVDFAKPFSECGMVVNGNSGKSGNLNEMSLVDQRSTDRMMAQARKREESRCARVFAFLRKAVLSLFRSKKGRCSMDADDLPVLHCPPPVTGPVVCGPQQLQAVRPVGGKAAAALRRAHLHDEVWRKLREQQLDEEMDRLNSEE
jgi:hypothetical protein